MSLPIRVEPIEAARARFMAAIERDSYCGRLHAHAHSRPQIRAKGTSPLRRYIFDLDDPNGLIYRLVITMDRAAGAAVARILHVSASSRSIEISQPLLAARAICLFQGIAHWHELGRPSHTYFAAGVVHLLWQIPAEPKQTEGDQPNAPT